MEGFKSETEHGVRSAFTDIAKIAGVAFGAEKTFEFGKEIISHAADVQKQVEVIKNEFGGASKAVLEFNEKGAEALGVSAHQADQTSARFGILFKNLGIGHDQAGKMTVGFEKLAGSLSAIRGVDPSTVLNNIPLAVAGNLRSLKQLGIATDQNQLKIAAFKLGLTQSISQGLTPAQRAIAIYSIATAHLSEYQAQAAAHSGDLANVERRLSAEWDNAKDKLGSGLLPIVTKFVKVLANDLPEAIHLASRAFRDLGATISGIGRGSGLGSLFGPVIKEVGQLRSAFSGGGFAGGIAKIKTDFQSLSPAAKGFAIALGAVALGFAAVVAAAFPITATILAIFGLGVALKEAYDHSAKFREIVGQLQDWLDGKLKPALHGIAKAAGPAFAQLYETAKTVFADVKKVISTFVSVATSFWKHFGSTVTAIAKNDFNVVVTVIKDALKIVEGVVQVFTGILTGDWGKAWSGLKEIAAAGLDSVKTEIEGFGKDAIALFSGIWSNVEVATLEALKKVTSYLAAIPTSFKVFGHKFGFDNPFGGVTDALDKKIGEIKSGKAAAAMAEAIASNTKKALGAKTQDPFGIDASVDSTTSKIKAKVKSAVSDGTSAGIVSGVDSGAAGAINTAKSQLANLQLSLSQAVTKMRQDIHDSIESAKQNLTSLGGTLANDIVSVLDAPFELASQKIQAAQDRIAAVFDVKNARIQAESSRVQAAQAKLGLLSDQQNLRSLRREVLLPGGKSLSQDPKKALAELNELSKSANNITSPALQAYIIQYRQALLQVQGDKIGIRGQALQAVNTSKTTALQQKSDQIRIHTDANEAIKRRTTRQIADLTDSYNRGAISITKFTTGIAAIMKRDHVSYKDAGKVLGTAFANGFRATAGGLVEQAKAIAAGPHRTDLTGAEPSIVRPLTLIHKDQASILKLHREIGNKQIALQRKIAVSAEKTAQAVKAIHDTQINPNATSGAKNPGRQSKTSRDLTGTTG